jgi:pimeloyl-ACP methyl ester carboxylesterase
LRELKLRTLFLVGDEEVIYDARKAVDRVKELIPRAETHIIPRASHCLNAEQSELVNGLILQFLQASLNE